MCKRFLRSITFPIGLVALVAAGFRQADAAGITVHFDQDVYTVNGPGEEIQAQILIDADPDRNGDQPVAGGLFSYGVKMSFNPAKGDVDSLADVVVPAEMDYFGFDSGALISVTPPGEVAVHANVQQDILSAPVGYNGTLLATVTLTNLATAVDMYPLNLDFSRDLGINEDFFVENDTGVTLDPMIMFVPSKVRVIPEPSTTTLGLLSLFSLLLWRVALRAR